MAGTQTLSISDAGEATGLSPHTLRYDERAGDGNERARLVLLEEHRTAVRAQLDEARRNLAAIETKIDLYRERIDH